MRLAGGMRGQAFMAATAELHHAVGLTLGPDLSF